MKHGPCATCLWWWDLYDTGERRCYRKISPFFHELTVDGCAKHEYSLQAENQSRHGGVRIDCYLSMRKEKKH